MRTSRVRIVVTVAALLVAAKPVLAQHHMDDMPASSWMWMTDANVFFGYNDQERKYTDFSTWESQNWFMLDGRRTVGAGTLTLTGMLSLEPFTFRKIGSPQVFQTGETYQGAPLVDYQHPHDLIMALGGRYAFRRGDIGYHFEAALVGAPALGPTPFMHRESARNNPQAPLIHHYTDSTHTTPGVLTAGIDAHALTLEASWFRGEEPDENRLDIDRPRLDSWSARGAWHSGPWRAQFSGGRLHRPEPFELFDITRLTASLEYAGAIGTRPLAASLIWGENREVHGILDGYLIEWDFRIAPKDSIYGRAELAARDLLDLGGPDPAGFSEFHRISHVDALTIGYVRDIRTGAWGRVGVGGDATGYRISEDLVDAYGQPWSFHVFVRYRR